ncbi:MAG: DUF4340 domain-containing protein [Parcubacteria group bacterium]|nr:DUF4340 domain-containing protein [Parcubacteria group bacterium]
MTLLISKFKNIFFLLGVLAVLLVGLGIYQGMAGNKNARSDATFFRVDADALDKIRILGVNGLYENVLEKRDDEWVVANKGAYRVNPEYIADLLKIFADLPRGELASRNPEKREELQVDDVGVKIQAWEGDTQVIDAIIGKEGPGFLSTYVRRADSDNVYLAAQNIRPVFNRTDWRDKRVWIFDPLKVTSIDWRYNEVEISLIKTGDGWKQVTPFSKDSSDAVIGPVLASLADLFAADIKEDVTKEQAGITGSSSSSADKAQTIRIELGFETGEKDALYVGDKLPAPSEEYYISRENSKLVWTLDSFTIEEIFKKEIGDF